MCHKAVPNSAAWQPTATGLFSSCGTGSPCALRILKYIPLQHKTKHPTIYCRAPSLAISLSMSTIFPFLSFWSGPSISELLYRPGNHSMVLNHGFSFFGKDDIFLKNEISKWSECTPRLQHLPQKRRYMVLTGRAGWHKPICPTVKVLQNLGVTCVEQGHSLLNVACGSLRRLRWLPGSRPCPAWALDSVSALPLGLIGDHLIVWIWGGLTHVYLPYINYCSYHKSILRSSPPPLLKFLSATLCFHSLRHWKARALTFSFL